MGPSAVPELEGWFLDPSTGMCDKANPAFFMSWSRKYFVVATPKIHPRTGDADVHCSGPGSCDLGPRALEWSVCDPVASGLGASLRATQS
jgi:hypothetical protein